MNDKLAFVNEQLIERIVPELREGLIGLAFREIFQLRENQFAIAFEGDEFRLLFIAIDSREPRIYLIKRRTRDLKKEKQNPSKFVVDAEHALLGMWLADVSKQPGERVVELRFERTETRFLVAQLTGKSSNLFLLDTERTIIGALRKPLDGEQSLGITYSSPDGTAGRKLSGDSNDLVIKHSHQTLSESLDAYFQERDAESRFSKLTYQARRKNQKEQAKLRRLIKNLEIDIQQHGDPEKWKKYGDLLLTSRTSAQRKGGSIIVRDLFDETAPIIEIEADEKDSLSETAQKYFRKYTKAKSAASEIASRIEKVRAEIESLEGEESEIEQAVQARDETFLSDYIGAAKDPETKRAKTRQSQSLLGGVRSFRSSDGFEILVGKKATDNDFVTFRIANSRDTWMHAADYPGSHVVVRNPDRKAIPQKTLIEAAQLAAFYSQGKKQTKAAVNYTEKKFVYKPKGAAPGLVRLASFKTILVEPMFPDALQR